MRDILRRIVLSFSAGLVLVSTIPCNAADADAPCRMGRGNLDFTVHRLDSGKPGTTALIVGGIQGDEPGGFNAAALVVTHYRILSGRVIVVPNLNFASIVKRSRGIYGDMNRKIDHLDPDDPEHPAIDRIKSLITSPQVDVILNLHDGSGFYSPVYESSMHHPMRWGQSIIIDQDQMPYGNASSQFSSLARAARQCMQSVNQRLLDPSHRVRVKNTRTAEGDREMAKTLTFFALRHHKPAFGIETSKSFLTARRVYYHLLAIESFLSQAGIEFDRRFELSETGICRAMDQDIALKIGKNRIMLYAQNIRHQLNFIPMEKDRLVHIEANHPLLTLVPQGGGFSLFHGNRRLARLYPQYFEYDHSLDHIEMKVDGRSCLVAFGSRIPVRNNFMVCPIPDHRVNIIGFSAGNGSNESGYVVGQHGIPKRFSIDRDGKIFRVEVYRASRFTGMVLVDFRPGAHGVRLAGAGRPGDSEVVFQ